MGRVLTNNLGLQYAVEESIGVLPSSPSWKQLEPNDISTYGAEITTVARRPISKNRQRRKGTITDLDSAVEFNADLTIDCFQDFIEGWVFAEALGGTSATISAVDASGNYTLRTNDDGYLLAESLVYVRGCAVASNNGLKVIDSITPAVAASRVLTLTPDSAPDIEAGDQVIINGIYYQFAADPTTGTPDGSSGNPFLVDIGGDDETSLDNLIAAINADGTGGTNYSAEIDTLYPDGHPDVTAADTSSTSVTVTAKVTGTAGNAITVAVANTTDLAWPSGTLTGGADLIVNVEETTTAESITEAANATLELAGYRGTTGDFEIDANGDLISTTLNFTTLGLMAGQALWIGGEQTANKFATAANYGYARIVSVAQNLIVLDKKSGVFAVDDGSGKTIHVYWGKFIRNVDVDDDEFLERSFQFELGFPNLGDAGATEYEYAKGNFCDEASFSLPLADKATVSFGFIGTDTEVPTDSRKVNAASAKEPIKTTAFNTSADIARLRITEVDETGLTTDFKSLSLTLRNNVSPEKVLGNLGARYMNTGIFEVDLEATLLFTSGAVVEAIRNNDTLTMDFLVRNDDGGIFVDIPALTLGGGDKEYPVDQSVTINTTAMAFQDPTLGTSIGVTIFPYLPPAA